MSSLIPKISSCIAGWASTMLKNVRTTPSLPERSVSLALQSLNQYTLDLYARKKLAVKRQLGDKIPLILANQNNLSSRYRGIQTDVEYIPQEYHLLKALAHTPIAVHMAHQIRDEQESERLEMKLEGLFTPYYECSKTA